MFIPEVSEGESLSSWMYRITLQRMFNRNFDASHIGEFEAGEMWAHVTLSSTGDPDFWILTECCHPSSSATVLRENIWPRSSARASNR